MIWRSRADVPLSYAATHRISYLRQECGRQEHTVDIGARREGGVVRECLGDIIVSAVYILVFLEGEVSELCDE